jgi:hypothetical protein
MPQFILGIAMFLIILPVTAFMEWREERLLRQMLRAKRLTNAQAHEWIGKLQETD